MVYLSPRLLSLAALVATAATPSFVPVANARAIDLSGRRHNNEHHIGYSESSNAEKGMAKDTHGSDDYWKIDDSSYHGSHYLLGGRQAHFNSKAYPNSRIYGRQSVDDLSQEFMQHDQDLRLEEQIYSAAVAAYHVLPTTAAQTKRDSDSDILKEIQTTDADTWDPLDPLLQIGTMEIGDGRHGSYSDTHSLADILKRWFGPMAERREPHHDDRLRDRTVTNGDSNQVVHAESQSAVIGNGCEGRCSVDFEPSSLKRELDIGSIPGVPGTIDIVNVGGMLKERLASLVLSTVNVTDNTSSNAMKSVSDSATSPFVLDASNSTQTQFFLVVSDAETSSNGSMVNTFTGNKETSIMVTLQVPVFESSEAAMRPYCATFDPNPPTPAPLTMERCFTDVIAANSSSGEMHKSQMFTYNPVSGIVAPLWSPALNKTVLSNSTTSGDAHEKQLSIKVPGVIKDMQLSNPSSNVTQAIDPSSNITQTINGTIPSPSALPSQVGDNAHNVTLVFSPVGPAVHAVSESSSAASFEPVDNDDMESDDSSDCSESGVDSLSTTDLITSSMSFTMATTESYSLSTTTDVPSSSSVMPSDFAEMGDMMSTSTEFESSVAAPTPTSTVDSAEIEKMYQSQSDTIS